MSFSSATDTSRIEIAVLGFCVSVPNALGLALAAGIHPGSFDDDKRAEAFCALVEEDKAGRPTSLVAAGMRYPKLARLLADCAAQTPMAVNPEAYIRELRAQCWQRDAWRELARLTTAIGNRRPWGELEPYKAEVLVALGRIVEGPGAEKGPVPIETCLSECLPKIEQAVADLANGKPPGISTGFAALDMLTGGGFGKGSINVAAARTGRGKTTLALNFLATAAKAGHSCAYFTVEMPRAEITQKLLSLTSAVSANRIRIGELTHEQQSRIADAQAELCTRRIWIDDSTEASLEAFEHACRTLKRRGPLDLVCIDYVQQFHLSRHYHTTHERITAVSHRLKQLALSLNVAVIALAQLNRQAEAGDVQPDIWHIKDSGAIEQDADLILLIHSDSDSCRLFVGKNRHGKDRLHIPIEAKLGINLFQDLAVNLEAFK